MTGNDTQGDEGIGRPGVTAARRLVNHGPAGGDKKGWMSVSGRHFSARFYHKQAGVLQQFLKNSSV